MSVDEFYGWMEWLQLKQEKAKKSGGKTSKPDRRAMKR
jgi:hypothetical protein